MHKWTLLIALMLGMASLSTVEAAQGGQRKGNCKGKGQQAAKEDGNGQGVQLRLRLRDGSCGADCAKECKGCGKNFLDSDGDGVCDNEGCKGQGGKGQCQRNCQRQRNGQGGGGGNGACVRKQSQNGQGQGGQGQGGK